YVWDPSNDLFNIPLTPPSQMDPTHNQFFRDGQLVKVLSNAFDPMGYTPNRQSGESSLIVRNDLTTIWNAFTPQNYQADQNFDGEPVADRLVAHARVRLAAGVRVPQRAVRGLLVLLRLERGGARLAEPVVGPVRDGPDGPSVAGHPDLGQLLAVGLFRVRPVG